MDVCMEGCNGWDVWWLHVDTSGVQHGAARFSDKYVEQLWNATDCCASMMHASMSHPMSDRKYHVDGNIIMGIIDSILD